MDNLEEGLEYYRRLRFSKQWERFLSALATEITTAYGPELCTSLLRAIGRRLATSTPIPACNTLSDMEAAINALFAEIDWGWLSITEAGRTLRIVHYEPPPFGDVEVAKRILGPTLEGMLTTWLQSQGADPALAARLSAADPPRSLQFIFGRLDGVQLAG